MLRVIGTGHLAIGAVAFRSAYAAMAADGLVDSLHPGHAPPLEVLEREQAFWFAVTGVCLLLLGDACASVEREGRELPRRLGVELGAVALLGGAVVPRSGFWSLLVPAAVVLRR